MMVFWTAGIVVLSVPRTGTHAWQAMLGAEADMIIRHPPEAKHMRAERFENRLRPLFERGGRRRLETVAVIREPLDWRASWYRYRARPALDGKPNSTAGVGFAAFLEETLSPDPPPRARIGRQSRFVSDSAGNVIVDHLFAYEDQPALAAFLSHRLGRQIDPPGEVRNAAPRVVADLPEAVAATARAGLSAELALHDRALGRGG